jgi:hypothetical protein
MVEHDSIITRVGFVIITLVGEFHFGLLDAEENDLLYLRLYHDLRRRE